MAENEVPSDVVELIIAVDLNPSNPEEPINVNKVDVRPEGGKDGDECPMCQKILDAVAKADPQMEEAVGGKSVKEALSALKELAGGAPEEAEETDDAFDKAMSRPMKKEESPFPKKKAFDDESPFPKKKAFGGFHGGGDEKPEDDFEKEPKDDEDENQPFGKKKRW